MASALHIIDEEVSADARRELAALLDPGDRIASLGPVDLSGEFAHPVHIIRKPLGSAAAAGLMAMDYGAGTQSVHAWSIPAAEAGEAIAHRHGCGMIVHLPHFPLARLGRLIMLASWGQVAVTVPTDACRRRLAAEGLDASAVHVVPPVGAAIENRQASRARTRQILGVSDAQRLMVAPGVLMRQAGHKYACWVFAVLRHIRDDVRLLIPAEGPARRPVQYFAASLPYDREIFMPAGAVSPAEALAAADLAVFLTHGDCPLAALAEAMAAGLPIVAWGTPDVQELTAAGQAAALSPPGDVRGASAEVLRLLEDPSAASALASVAARRARERFSAAAARTALEGIVATLGHPAPA